MSLNLEKDVAEPGQVMARVLVVEDDEAVSLTLGAVLARAGYAVDVASDVPTALTRLATSHADAVLLDLRLGGDDGFTVLERLRQVSPGTIAIILTGAESLETAVRALRLGAADFFRKPADPPSLLSALDRALSRRRAELGAVERVAAERAELLAREQDARREAERAADRARCLVRVTAALAGSRTLHDVADVVASEITPALGARAGGFLALSDDGASLVVVVPREPSPSLSEAANLGGEVSPAPSTPLGDAIRTGELIVLESAAEWRARYPHPAPPPAPGNEGAVVAMPIRVKDRAVAVIHLDYAEARRFDREDRALLRAVGQQCALAYERARLDAEAAAAGRLRDEFVGVAAHELKTPLTIMLGNVQIMQRQLARTERPDLSVLRPRLATIEQEIRRLAGLADRLFDLTQLDAERLVVRPVPTDLTPLLDEVVATARASAAYQQISLRSPGPIVAPVDPLRLGQVVTHLVENAIRFSPDGGPIELDVAASAGEVIIRVTDHGIGIPVGERTQLFDRFARAHRATHRSGLGLGLHVCRRICELHRGSLVAEFPEEGGTRFVIRLPMAALAPARLARRHGHDAREDGGGSRAGKLRA